MNRWILMLAAVGSIPATAEAHLGLIQPVSRYGINVLKFGPCGRTGGTRSQNVATFSPGETIMLQWDEYVDHPGHFRVAFDADGDDDFVDPACTAGCNSRTPTIEFYSNASVLMDDIPDTVGGMTTIMVTLPDVECTNCTLQAIQVMYDKPPYVIPGNDIYYQCVDLILARPPAMDAGSMDVDVADTGSPSPDAGTSDSGTDEDGGGCTCVSPRHQMTSTLSLLALVGLRRRR